MTTILEKSIYPEDREQARHIISNTSEPNPQYLMDRLKRILSFGQTSSK